MGRIVQTTVNVRLERTGYQVRVSVFDHSEVIHREQYDSLSWRESQQVADAVLDAYRPGLELLHGGVQDTLF